MKRLNKYRRWIQNFTEGSTDDVAVAFVPRSSALMHKCSSVIIHAHQETESTLDHVQYRWSDVIPLQHSHDFGNERFEVEYMFLNL